MPFVFGGAERFLLGLVNAINQGTAHQADLIKVPVRERTLDELVTSYLAFTQLDLSGFDLVISGKYPAWMINHDRHVVYLLHRLRGLYDTYPEHLGRQLASGPDCAVDFARWLADVARGAQSLPEFVARYRALVGELGVAHPVFDLPGPLSRQIIHYFDDLALDPGRIRRYAAISGLVRARAEYFPTGAEVAVLHPPTALEGLRPETERQEYFLAVSRLDGPKRLDLVVSALRQSRTRVPLKIAGTGPQEARLRALAGEDPRISFVGHVADAELAALYQGALAVLFVPQWEDYGLVALEAMRCGKPVITVDDAGGVLELVTHGESGLVTAPDPNALAQAIDALAENTRYAARLGEAARQRAEQVTWPRVLEGLLGTRRPGAPALPGRRPRIVVATASTCHPPMAGGAARIRHLFGAMSEHADVEIITLGDPGTRCENLHLPPNLIERRIPMSAAHLREEERLRREIGFAQVGDLALERGIRLTPQYQEALRHALADADLAIACQPYVWCEALAEAPCPRILDAQNVEYRLKQAILPRTAAAQRALEYLRRLEGRVLAEVDLVIACASDDAQSFFQIHGVAPTRIAIVANGVNCTDTPFRLPSERTANPLSAVFLGSWHQPNVEAVTTIVQIARNYPGVAFLVAGSVCSARRANDWPTNVVALGQLAQAEKQALLLCAQFALNPVSSGSGTNLKMLDYLAAGLTVITTPIGARGIDLDDAMLITAPEGFSRGLRQALDLPMHRRDAMARVGRQTVERHFDWRVLADRFLRETVTRGLLPAI
jgi:glycosyltransferase involved in cell wall biosynthesis